MEKTNVYNFSEPNSAENKDFLPILLSKAKNGEEAAFGELYSLYFKRIFKFVYYRVGHKEVAEDLTEEVFIKAYTKLASVQQNSSFEGWLYQIARNTVIDHYRDKKMIVALEEVENTLEYESNIVNVLELQDEQKVLLKLIKELEPDQQVIIKLKFLEDLDNPEIAALTNKTEGAIRVIQHRAITKLKQLIKNSPPNIQL